MKFFSLHAMDVFGKALRDYFDRKPHSTLWLYNTYGEPEEMPIDIFFRDIGDMPELERLALKHCKGKILDVGAGVGSHALLLQSRNMEVTALEISSEACKIMKERGVKNVVHEDFFSYRKGGFDTILLLMNGIGLCSQLSNLDVFLKHARELLQPEGCLIFDSSDLSYLYQTQPYPKDHYYGEIGYQYQYKNEFGDWFKWLYVDQYTLREIAEQEGWNCELLLMEATDQYLVKLTPY